MPRRGALFFAVTPRNKILSGCAAFSVIFTRRFGAVRPLFADNPSTFVPFEALIQWHFVPPRRYGTRFGWPKGAEWPYHRRFRTNAPFPSHRSGLANWGNPIPCGYGRPNRRNNRTPDRTGHDFPRRGFRRFHSETVAHWDRHLVRGPIRGW